MQVAVIIPIYKTEATLARCIDSVLAQTMPASEIILVDDGSPDHAGDIADDYALKHDCIKTIHKPNGGLAEARRTGVSNATTPLVMFLDSDDTLSPDAIEFMHGKIMEHNLDMAYGCYRRIEQGSNPFEQHHPVEGVLTGEQFLAQNLSLGAINSCCNNLSRRDLWTDDIFPPHDMLLPSEDTITTIALSFKCQRVGQWNHPTYNYYCTPGSLSVSGRLSQQSKWKQYFNLLEDMLNAHGVAQRYARHLHILKVDRLAFYIKELDTSDKWTHDIINDHSHNDLPTKTQVLQSLLHVPRLLHLLIAINRQLKRWSKGVKA